MGDIFSVKKRSAVMSAVHRTGNFSTEHAMRKLFRAHHVTGWRTHVKNLPGRPDFVFLDRRVVVFVDGCFWHGCPTCGHFPKRNQAFWRGKIMQNRHRDLVTKKRLTQIGITVVRIWEHDLRQANGLRGATSRLWETLVIRKKGKPNK